MFPSAVSEDLRDTVDALKGVFGDPAGATPNGVNADGLEWITKTFGVTSGFQPFDLSQIAYFYQPVFCPIRNRLPRLHLQGKNMEFKSVVNVDSGTASPLMAEGVLATSIVTQEADVAVLFKAYGNSSDPVTMEGMFTAVGKAGDFSVDMRAVASANLLKKLLLIEERLILGGVGAQAQIVCANTAPDDGLVFTIGGPVGNAPAGGTLAGAVAAGGTATGTVYGYYTAVTSNAIPNGMPTNGNAIPFATSNAGESLKEASQMSIALGGSQNAVVFTPPSALGGFPIILWKLYLGTVSGTVYFAGLTTGAPIVVPVVPASGPVPPTTDRSATPDASSIAGYTGSSVEGYFNGIIPWLLGTASGTGTAGAAIHTQINGPLTLPAMQNAFGLAFNQNSADPDHLWLNSYDLITLSNALTGNNAGQPYWVAAKMGEEQGDFVAGIRVSRFLNPATGRLFPVNVHAYLPQGTALALSTELPSWIPGNNVPAVWCWGGVMDYLQIDLPLTPALMQWTSQMECVGAIHCFLPSQNVIFTGISQ